MSQLFHPSMNFIVRIGLPLLILVLAGVGGLGYYAASSPYVTEVGVAKAQPVAFSHKQHVGGLGLDCRYCHTFVETSNSAGIPPTETCMGCHNQVAATTETLALVRQSVEEATPLEWVRLHNLADYVYFNHAIHVKQGVGCETCHGRIDQMPVVMKVETLQMDWCLACHRDPAAYLRPRDAVFTMGYEPPIAQEALGPQLIAEHGVQTNHLTDCSVCHR